MFSGHHKEIFSDARVIEYNLFLLSVMLSPPASHLPINHAGTSEPFEWASRGPTTKTPIPNKRTSGNPSKQKGAFHSFEIRRLLPVLNQDTSLPIEQTQHRT